MDNSSLVHSKWNCKYHILFEPKYRRQIQDDIAYDKMSLKEYIDLLLVILDLKIVYII